MNKEQNRINMAKWRAEHKAEHDAYLHEYYLKHKAEIRERQRLWLLAHPDYKHSQVYKDSHKKYEQTHKEARRLRTKKYKETHREEVKARQRARYRKNPQALIAKSSEWRLKNLERYKEYQREYYLAHRKVK